MYSLNNKMTKSHKTIVLLSLAIFILVSFSIRLFSMQVIHGKEYQNQSITIKNKITSLPAQRGQIYAVNERDAIVINSDSYAVEVTPGEIPSSKYDSVMMRISSFLGISKEEIDKKITSDKRRQYTPIRIKSHVPFKIICNIAENKTDLPGVSWVSKPIREYHHTQSLSHIIGYVGDISQTEYEQLYNQGYSRDSVIGKNGIEKQYDYLLQGKPGNEIYTVDVHGRVISDTPTIVPPVSGKNLVLTIDSEIQKLAEDTLGQRVGAVVVLKPYTGEILAMVSYPYFDSNIFNQDNAAEEYSKLLNDESKPLINRAVQVSYPPASTFKIIMSAALLQEQTYSPAKKIKCTGELEYGNHTFHCHEKHGHGYLDLKNGLALSCDVYFWTIGKDYLGIDKIASYAKEFGFGQSSQIDLPSQDTGLVPTADWKEKTYHEKWMGGDTMSCSIGQGYMAATPLQLANMMAMVSNEGIIYKPHILKEIRDSVNPDKEPEIIPREILTKSTIDNYVWKTLQEDLRYVVTDGTPVYPMGNKWIKIACKTGTAEVEKYKNSDDPKHWHSWLVAYAPVDAPPEDRICVATIVEAVNKWEWWAPYATNIIINGIYRHKNYEESITELGFKYLDLTLSARME